MPRIIPYWTCRLTLFRSIDLKPGVEAGFTTRHFPLVLHKTDDLLDHVNQKKFVSLFNGRRGGFQTRPYTKFALLDQVHGDGIVVIEKDPGKGIHHFKECDAVITNIPGLALLVFTADCLSIFYTAGDWIALAHAGWRGTKQKIAQKTFKMLLEKSKKRPEDVKVVFGPSIRACHYESDLPGENRRQLSEVGLPVRSITDLGICTIDENDNFYSFRKEKDSAGRIISYIVK